MAYPFHFLKLSFGGGLAQGAEIWTNGINFGLPTADVGFEEGDYDTALPNIATSIQEWFVDNRLGMPNSATLEWVKLAYIKPDGEYFRDADVYDYPSAVVGTQPGLGKLVQQSTAVTFESARRRAPGRFARIYPPMTGTPGNDGYVSHGEAEGIRDATAEMIAEITEDLRVASGQNIVPIVASQKTTSNNEIVTVKVGRIVDVQRRRRNRLPELYSPAVVIDYP